MPRKRGRPRPPAGEWLASARQRAGLGQVELARRMTEASGDEVLIDHSWVGKLERGVIQGPEDPLRFRLLAAALGVSQVEVFRAFGWLTEEDADRPPRFPAGSWRAELDRYLGVVSEHDARILVRFCDALAGEPGGDQGENGRGAGEAEGQGAPLQRGQGQG